MNIENKLKFIEKLLKNKKDLNYFFNIYFQPKNIDIYKLKDLWSDFVENWDKNIVNFYVHTPFCVEKCKFCQYHWFKIEKVDSLNNYVEYLKNYITLFQNEISKINFSWLYFWWWTPSIYSEEQLDSLLNFIFSRVNFNWKYYKEFELNPVSTTINKIDILYKYWFNRITFWLQSFNKPTLEKEWRIYCSPLHLKNLVTHAKAKWFKQINADLIIWLNDEKKEDILNSLKLMMDVNPHTITIYTLQENKEKSSLYWKDEEEYYKNVREVHEFLIKNIRENNLYFYPNIEENSLNTWIVLFLKSYKLPELIRYDTHVNWVESIFWLWFWAYSNIFSYWKYYIPDKIYNIEDISIKYQETLLKDELDIFLCRSIQWWEIDIKFFIKNFNYNILIEKKDEIDFLIFNNKIKIINDSIIFNTSNIKETYIYWFLFFDVKFIIKHSLFIDKNFKK